MLNILSPSDCFKCCCLPSLRTTSSSLSFIEKVRKSLAYFLDVHSEFCLFIYLDRDLMVKFLVSP